MHCQSPTPHLSPRSGTLSKTLGPPIILQGVGSSLGPTRCYTLPAVAHGPFKYECLRRHRLPMTADVNTHTLKPLDQKNVALGNGGSLVIQLYPCVDSNAVLRSLALSCIAESQQERGFRKGSPLKSSRLARGHSTITLRDCTRCWALIWTVCRPTQESRT